MTFDCLFKNRFTSLANGIPADKILSFPEEVYLTKSLIFVKDYVSQHITQSIKYFFVLLVTLNILSSFPNALFKTILYISVK